MTRDLAYAVNKLSRYTSNPSVEHWKMITKVLRYLRYTHDFRLHYIIYIIVIKGYNDVNWISGVKDSKYTSEYLFTLEGTIIS